MPPREWALLNWFADRCKAGKGGIIAPTKNINDRNIDSQQLGHISQLTEEYLAYYSDHKNEEDIDISVDKKFFQGAKSRLQTALKESLGIELAAKLNIDQGAGKGSPFQLRIAPESIIINSMS